MRIGISSYRESFLVFVVLGVVLCGSIAADEPDAVYSYDVVCYKDAKGKEQGKLTFTEEGVVFECTAMDSLQRWAYGDLKAAEMPHDRLLRLMPAKGKTLNFSPFGGQSFDPELAQFIKGKLAGTAM